MLDYNAISDALLSLLKTATWVGANGVTQESFGMNPPGCNATRKMLDFERAFNEPQLCLQHPDTDVQQSQAFGLAVERIYYKVWIYLVPNSDLSVQNVPDEYLTRCEIAVRNTLQLRYPLTLINTNNPALGYMPLPPGWVQTFGGMVGNEAGSNGAYVEGRIMRYDGVSDGPPMILMIPITVLAGNP